MADLLTHFVSARVPGAFLRDRRLQALLVIGTFLPDIAAKGLYWVLQAREKFQTPTHSVVGVFLIAYLACLFVEQDLRRPGFALLAIGGLIHIGVDLMKDHNGIGSAFPLFPFSAAPTELGWVDPENVAIMIPIDIAILTATWLLERRLSRVRE